jgi:hypothetical protein
LRWLGIMRCIANKITAIGDEVDDRIIAAYPISHRGA